MFGLGIYGGGDALIGLARTVLPAIESVAVEHENIVQVNIIKCFYVKRDITIFLIIYNSKPNLFYFLGQCESSYGLPSSYVSQCKACGIKQLHSM